MNNNEIYFFIILVIIAIPLLNLIISMLLLFWKGAKDKTFLQHLQQAWRVLSMKKMLSGLVLICALGILGYWTIVLLLLYDYHYLVQHVQTVIKALSDQDNLIFSAIILIIFFLGLILSLLNKFDNLRNFLPSLAVSVGIFGTFWGIFIGLSEFDTYNISGSIPFLLNGMKTAFVTSLIGILASILLRIMYVMISDLKYNNTKSIASMIQSIEDLTTYNQKMQEEAVLANVYLKQLTKMTNKNNHFMQDKLKSLEENLVQNNQEIKNFAVNLSTATSNVLAQELHNLIDKFNNNLADLVGESFKQLTEATQRLVTWQENFQEIIRNDTQNLSDLFKHIHILNQYNDNLADRVGESFKRLTEAIQKLQTWQENFQEIMQNHTQTLSNLFKHLHVLNQYYNNSLLQFKQANDVLHNLVQTISSLQQKDFQKDQDNDAQLIGI